MSYKTIQVKEERKKRFEAFKIWLIHSKNEIVTDDEAIEQLLDFFVEYKEVQI